MGMAAVFLSVCSEVGMDSFLQRNGKVCCFLQSCDVKGDWLAVFGGNWFHRWPGRENKTEMFREITHRAVFVSLVGLMLIPDQELLVSVSSFTQQFSKKKLAMEVHL